MSSPYFTGTLVEAVVEMFSCSGEYIGLGWLRFGGGGGGGGGELQQGERDRKEKGGDGRGKCRSTGARGRRGEGREKVSWASAPPSHASCVQFWKQHLSCPEEWWRVQMLVCLLKRSRFCALTEEFNFREDNDKKQKINLMSASHTSSKLLPFYSHLGPSVSTFCKSWCHGCNQPHSFKYTGSHSGGQRKSMTERRRGKS